MQQNNVAVNMANDECKSFYVGDARNMQYIHSNREIPTVVVGDLNEARAPLLRPGNGDATFSNDLRSNRPSATSLHSAESASVVRHQKTNQTIAELYDLQLQKSEGEWFETARWIKYEEDAEGVDRYWGQPHVSFLSFNSLMHLRRCFMKGILLLNLNAMSFTQISDRLSETLMANGVSMAMTKRIVDTLQLKHRYPQTAGIRRISTAASNLLSRRPSNTSNVIYSSADLLTVESTTSRRNESSGTKIVSILNRRSLSLQPAINENRSCSMTKNTELNVNHQKSCKRNSTDILHSNGETQSRRTPLPSVELAQVFAGTLPTLTKTIFVMIRLTEQTVFCETSEESTPVRFIFIIIGPENNDVCYHEIGRAVSTLMVNKHFNAIAYDADDRCALIKGIDQFLDDSVVIPPGEIDSKRLVSGDEIFKALKRRRKRKAAEKSEADSIQIAMNENGVKMKSGCKRMRRIPFGEMLDDIRGRLPYYWLDIEVFFSCIL
ncbi:hypothetical protein AB6A40_004500 [Gnathostoma spinigerum]|uniref:Band 3 cytoplasmic domain-containing protein n=1 Tax=Gnathostoma spinigerum TaxID=75299 RepID=A0ABD6EEZ3_9BILA